MYWVSFYVDKRRKESKGTGEKAAWFRDSEGNLWELGNRFSDLTRLPPRCSHINFKSKLQRTSQTIVTLRRYDHSRDALCGHGERTKSIRHLTVAYHIRLTHRCYGAAAGVSYDPSNERDRYFASPVSPFHKVRLVCDKCRTRRAARLVALDAAFFFVGVASLSPPHRMLIGRNCADMNVI